MKTNIIVKKSDGGTWEHGLNLSKWTDNELFMVVIRCHERIAQVSAPKQRLEPLLSSIKGERSKQSVIVTAYYWSIERDDRWSAWLWLCSSTWNRRWPYSAAVFSGNPGGGSLPSGRLSGETSPEVCSSSPFYGTHQVAARVSVSHFELQNAKHLHLRTTNDCI